MSTFVKNKKCIGCCHQKSQNEEGTFLKHFTRNILSIFYPELIKAQITRANEKQEETSI